MVNKQIIWYDELGFKSNPFSIKPGAFDHKLFGYNEIVTEINTKIKANNILFIHGAYGTGKTSILKKIIEEFKGNHQVIYYNYNKSEGSVNFDKLLIGAGNFISKLFKIKKKNMILFLDESQDMNKKDMFSILKYKSQGFFKSIVLVSKKEDISFISDLKKEIKDNTFDLNILSDKNAISLVKNRLGTNNIISDSLIIKIFNKNRNPRAFLRNCENVCKFAFDSGSKSISIDHLKILN